MQERQAYISITYNIPALYAQTPTESTLIDVKAIDESQAKEKAIEKFIKQDSLGITIIKEVEFLRWVD